jgi:hypothetical protein
VVKKASLLIGLLLAASPEALPQAASSPVKVLEVQEEARIRADSLRGRDMLGIPQMSFCGLSFFTEHTAKLVPSPRPPTKRKTSGQ